MLFKNVKDLNLRQSFATTENTRVVLKFLFTYYLNADNALSMDQRARIVKYLLGRLDKGISKTQLVRRCVFTNRSRVSHRSFGISRIKLRELFTQGIVPNVSRAIW